jgi:hypothetical protein
MQNVSFDISLKNILDSASVIIMVVMRKKKKVRMIASSELVSFHCIQFDHILLIVMEYRCAMQCSRNVPFRREMVFIYFCCYCVLRTITTLSNIVMCINYIDVKEWGYISTDSASRIHFSAAYPLGKIPLHQ